MQHIENQFLMQHIGKTKTKNLVEEINKNWHEDFLNKFPSYDKIVKANSLLTTTKENEIKNIGMSCINDLLSDSFGLWFGHLLGQIGGYNMINVGNVSKAYKALGAGTKWNNTDNSVAIGCAILVGTGTTPATRQDFKIETAFTGEISTGNGGWNSGLGQVSFSMSPLVAGGGASLSETAWYFSMATNSAIHETNLFSRDNISPVVPVVIGETINVDYTLGFT